MISLHDLQREFMRAVLDERRDESLAETLPVVAGGIASAERLEVYAGNVRANFSSALVSSYPITERLVGGAYFERCARGFQREHPSRCGDLQPAGARFPEYLGYLHGGGEYGYLGDVARFEWLLQEAWLAADHPPLDVGRLALVAPDDYDDLEFVLHPSLRLFESTFPCMAIWQANSRDEEPELIDLSASAHERIAIVHTHGEMQFHPLSPGEHAFLKAIASEAPFVAAAEAGDAVEADGTDDTFDAGAALRRFVAAAVIVDFR